MSDGVRSRPPPSGPSLKRTEPSEAREPSAANSSAAAAGKEAKPAHDVYEAGSAAAHAQFKQQIQAATSRSLRDLKFNNQELEAIAQNMLTFVKAHPNAARGARAKGFARAILKGGRGKLGKIVDQMNKEEAEQMFDDIGNMLSESPRLAEWIENLTEHLKKL